VNAAFCPDTGIGATGAIIRDAAGMFIAACSVLLPRAIDATSAEAKTISVEGGAPVPKIPDSKYVIEALKREFKSVKDSHIP